MTRMLGVLIVAATLLISCDVFNCNSEMSKARNRYGTPERTTTYTSSGYNSTTYWWYRQGRSMTFAWGANVTGCNVSTYTFSPIYKPTTAAVQDSLDKIVRLESEAVCGSRTIMGP